jgi:hypothetical protein
MGDEGKPSPGGMGQGGELRAGRVMGLRRLTPAQLPLVAMLGLETGSPRGPAQNFGGNRQPLPFRPLISEGTPIPPLVDVALM